MYIKFQRVNEEIQIPKYAHSDDSGMDLCSRINCILSPGERKLIPTGLRVQLPRNIEAQIRPRSGLALKNGITVLNTPGTIDAGYRGELGVILINLGDEPYCIQKGDRIAQMVFQKVLRVAFKPVKMLKATTRGENGFGSTNT